MIAAIARKDLTSLWASPVPWVLGALFHIVLGLLYVSELIARRQALIQPLFPLAGFLLIVTVPLIAMRSLADEARSGTLELLLSVPVGTRPVVIGKWLSAWITSLGIIAPTFAAVLLLVLYGSPDPGPIIAGYLGLVLFSGALSSIGVAASSFTSSQPVAAMGAFFISLMLWFAHIGSQRIATGPLLAHFSMSERLRSFAGGVIDTADVVFLILVAATGLVIAATALEARRLK